jgi:hypothetical protein
MSHTPERRPRLPAVDTDLVEYLIVAMPDLESFTGVAAALADLVDTEAIRVLDLVVVRRADDGGASVLELEEVDSLASLAEVDGEVGGMLSGHDVELASIGLRPGTAALVLLVEDRWAGPLAAAARRAGGRVIGGDRIPRPHVEVAVADTSEGPDREVRDDATRGDVPE